MELGNARWRTPVRAASTTLCVGLAAVAAVGCGSTSGGSKADVGSNVKLESFYGKAAGPVDSISWGLPYGEPPTLDPPNTAYYSATLVDSQMCDTLERLQPDGSTKPELATVVETNPTTITLNLKKGIRFWDGQEMTSADVKASLDHTRDPETAIGALFASIKSVTADSRYTATIHLSTPDVVVRKELYGLGGMIWEKRFAEKAGRKFGTAQGGIMCSGPYKFQKWNSGTSIELTANDDYWDPAYKPHAKHVSMKFFSDSTTLASALRSGEVDGAYEVPAQTIPSLSKSSAGALHYGPADLYVGLNVARPDGPLKNKDLVTALSMTLDREAIAKAVFYGAATPYYTAINPGSWDPAAKDVYAEAYRPYEEAGRTFGSADAIAKAKKMVEAAGAKGTSIKVMTQAGDVTMNKIAQLVQQQAKAIGLNVVIDPLQAIKFTEATYDAKARGDADLMVSVSFNGLTDPLEGIPFSYLPDAAYNYDGFNDPQVTRLLGEARAGRTPEERAKLMVQAQTIIEKAGGNISLVEPHEISFLNKRLSGMTTSFNYLGIPSLATIGAAGTS